MWTSIFAMAFSNFHKFCFCILFTLKHHDTQNTYHQTQMQKRSWWTTRHKCRRDRNQNQLWCLQKQQLRHNIATYYIANHLINHLYIRVRSSVYTNILYLEWLDFFNHNYVLYRCRFALKWPLSLNNRLSYLG